MRTRRAIARRWAAAASIASLALLSIVPATSPAVAAGMACTDPPAVFPISRVANGQTATGWTVLQGTTPESFTVTLLGVLTDAIAPGRDAILVKASGANIDAIGGMGPGFSGSPVYRNGQLVGSISYGLGGDPHYGALTPGQDLVNVLLEPSARVASAERIRLSRAARDLIARDAGMPLSSVSSTLSQIPLPLAVPDLSAGRIEKVADRFAAHGVPVVPFTAGSTSASATVRDTHPIEPGDVFVAAISFGSVPYAALGTASITCGDFVVAFGHSFTHGGSGGLGAVLDGDIVATIPAGNDSFPVKMGNIGYLYGVLDQDRLAGVRGTIGVAPSLTEITSSITNLDTGTVANATTQVARRQWLAGVAADHMYYTLHSALDADRGTSQVSWTIVLWSRGQQYEVELQNAHYGDRVIWGAADDVYASIRSLLRADGPAHIVSVHVVATVTEHRQVDAIQRARTASTAEQPFAVRNAIDVHPGDTLRVRVPLRQGDTGEVHVAQTTFTIPRSATGDGSLEIGTARPHFWFSGLSLEGTIAKLLAQPSSQDLRLRVRMRGAHALARSLPQLQPLVGGDEVALNLLRR
jgi:hypothetical protein